MKKLYRSRKDLQIAGICGGLGEMFSVDPTLLRLAVVLLCVFTGILPLVLVYVVGWIIIPPAPAQQ
jgi:phage shock protein PspC (stress-responsive transcriptional regulator)